MVSPSRQPAPPRTAPPPVRRRSSLTSSPGPADSPTPQSPSPLKEGSRPPSARVPSARLSLGATNGSSSKLSSTGEARNHRPLPTPPATAVSTAPPPSAHRGAAPGPVPTSDPQDARLGSSSPSRRAPIVYEAGARNVSTTVPAPRRRATMDSTSRRERRMTTDSPVSSNHSPTSTLTLIPSGSRSVSQSGASAKLESEIHLPKIPNVTRPTPESALVDPTAPRSMRYPMNKQMVSQKKPAIVFAALQNVLDELGLSHTAGDNSHCATIVHDELVFEADIVKIPRLNMYGVHFRRLKGEPQDYKELCTEIISRIQL